MVVMQSAGCSVTHCVPILPNEQTFVRADRWVTYVVIDKHARIARAGIA